MEEDKKDWLESLATRLYAAALEGNVPSLLNLLQLDPLILDRCCIKKLSSFNQSPLHVAANLGHLEFVTEILRRKPRMAEELDHTQRSSPLHVSSANGHLEIVKALLAVNPNMCLVRDQEGKNPIHVAAINGQVHVLEELLRAKPPAAREQTHGGESALHLCVKHNQLQSLDVLLGVMDDAELLNFKDNNGNTVLHLPVAAKQLEMVELLLKDERMAKNVINSNGLTAMDICLQSKKDQHADKILQSLKSAKALRGQLALRPRSRDHIWLENQHNALMVVASLIATMAFQVGVNPPGGYWQDDDKRLGRIAGFSIMADKDAVLYDKLLISSTVGLVSSLSVILLLISGLPCRRLFVAILMITMWIAVSATTMTYLASVNFVSNSDQHRVIWLAVRISLVVWWFLMILLLLGHVRLVMKLLKQLQGPVAKLCRRCFSRSISRPCAV